MLYNDAGLVSFLGNTFQNKNEALDNFTFTSNPAMIYGYPFAGNFFSEYGVASSGLSIVSGAFGGGCCNETTGSLVASDGTLLYTNTGQVWNPATSALVGTYSASSGLLFYEPGVLPDTANSRTYILDDFAGYDGTSGYTDVLSFDQTTFKQVGSVSIAIQEYNFVDDLNRWGADGFAFRSAYQTSLDEIVIFRSSIAHTATGATPSLTNVTPSSATVGTATTQITVTGSGFVPGATVLWNGAALGTVYVSATQLTALAPTTEFASAGTAQITVINPSGNSSSAVTFSVLGPQITLSTNAINFGSQQIGASSAAMQVTVSNTGSTALTGLAFSITGTDAASFVQTNTCGTSLAASANCAVSISFAPTAVGSKSAVLTVMNGGTIAPQSVSLSGTGTDASFTLSGATTPTQTVSRGGSAVFTFPLSPAGSTFGSAVTFSVTGVPTGATATFSPASIAAGSSATDVSMTVQIPANLAHMERMRVGKELAPFTLALLLAPFAWRRRRASVKLARAMRLLLVLCVSAGFLGAVGCSSGGSSNTTPPPPPTPESFTLTVTAASGAISHTSTVTLNVQ